MKKRKKALLPYYLILNVDETSSDETIRESYLELVKKYSPEKHPKRFRLITEAYEALKDKRNRIWMRTSSEATIKNSVQGLNLLAESRWIKKRRVTIAELFEAERETGKKQG